MDSILHDGKVCYLCGGDKETLDWHHVFGGSNRKYSEKYGLKVRLCHMNCHIFGPHSAHKDRDVANRLKVIAQKEFEKTHSREEFMDIFGRNYILDEFEPVKENETREEDSDQKESLNESVTEVLYPWRSAV